MRACSPRCCRTRPPGRGARSSSDAAAGLITAPSGARLPRSTAMPRVVLQRGVARRITSSSQICASSGSRPAALPVTVTAVGSSRSAPRAAPRAARPARCRSSMRNRPAGCRSTSSGTLGADAVEVVEPSARRRAGRRWRAGARSRWWSRRWRRARRSRCGTTPWSGPCWAAARPPPSPRRAGRRRASASSSRLSGAGVPATPGIVMPSASATTAIVEAVPMVLQWPLLRIIADSDSRRNASVMSVPARTSSTKRHTSVPQPSGFPRKCPVSIGPPGTTTAGRSTDARPSAAPGWSCRSPPSRTTPSTGLARSISSISIAARLRQSIAVGRICVSPSDITGRFSGIPPASYTPCLTRSRPRRGACCRASGPTRCSRSRSAAAVEGVIGHAAAHPRPVEVGCCAGPRRRTTAPACGHRKAWGCAATTATGSPDRRPPWPGRPH
jgi:hypothetical protein